MAHDYDLVVIGGGPAGEKGAVQAAYFGKRVLLIEKEPEPGGAAVHTGTLPSKTLREAAIYLSGYRARELYGISVSVDREQSAPRLLSRKDRVRAEEVQRIRWNLERHGVEIRRGRARFVDAHTVEVLPFGGQVSAEKILIAVGSRPYRPSNIDFADRDIEDSDSVLELDHVPESLTVIGGGVIGCEYATIFAALGVDVVLVEPRDTLLPFLDAEMSERLQNAMLSMGIDLKLGASYERVSRCDSGISTTLAGGGAVVTEQLLFAAGRGGATADLGLEQAGLEVGKRGYLDVDQRYRTAVSHIYAAGDCIGFPALASTSMEQARVAICDAFELEYKQRVSPVLPYGIYTIPEVSCVGLTEAGAHEAGHSVVVGRAFFRDNARGKIVGDTEGVLKLVFDGSNRRLLGVHVLGDRASELVHIGQLLIKLEGGIDTLIDMVFNFPTLSETYKYAAYSALDGFN